MVNSAAELRDWNAACLRLEDYLRAHRVQNREMLLRLTINLLDEARRLHRQQPDQSPLEVTMRLAAGRVDAWFAGLIDGEKPEALSAARARVVYFGADADRRWPSAFLDPNPPEELVSAIRSGSIQAGPDLEFSSLVRKEIDYGPMEDLARETWDQFSWRHVLGAFLIWLAIFFAAYGTYLSLFQ